MDEIIPLFIKSRGLSAGLNTQRVFAAWDVYGDNAFESAMHAERCSLLIVKQQPEEASACHADILG